MWNAIEMFDAFSIKAVPREENTLTDAPFVAACTFEIPECLRKRSCNVEVLFRPFVQDHWLVFNDDAQIVRFLHCIDNSPNGMITRDD